MDKINKVNTQIMPKSNHYSTTESRRIGRKSEELVLTSAVGDDNRSW